MPLGIMIWLSLVDGAEAATAHWPRAMDDGCRLGSFSSLVRVGSVPLTAPPISH